MTSCIAWIVLLIFLMACSYFSIRKAYFSISTGVLMLAYSYGQLLSPISLGVLWILFLGFSVFQWVRPLRLLIFSKPLMRWFARQQPTLSNIEQQVIDAGGVFIEKEFFTGQPNWQAIYDMPITRLTAPEQAFLDKQVTTLCNMLNDWEINHKDKDLPKEAWDYIKSEGFWGICLDQKYGGLGFSQVAHSAIVSKVATCSISAAYTVMVPNSIGPAELIDHSGTDQQKAYYLPRLANGDEIGCFALTSPDAGSDAASLTDCGVVCHGEYGGEHVLGIKINFSKRYITLAPVATLIGLAFVLQDPDHLIGDNTEIGITVALIPREHPGVAIGHRHFPMHLGFMNGPIRGKDVFIPLDWVLGGVEKCGLGWQMLMECLAVGRGISMPALASAIGRQCFLMTGAYAKIRRQFHRSIGEFEGVQEALAAIGGWSYIIEATRYMTTQAVVDGARPAVASAISKYHLTELSRQIVQNAMDIHSGHALQAGPSNLLPEIYNGLLVSTVGEGANIMTRNLIIFGQGVVRSHKFLKDEIQAVRNLEDPSSQLLFDKLLMQHIAFLCSQLFRGMVAGFTGCQHFKVKESSWLKPYLKQLNRIANALTLYSDLTLYVFGKNLKIKESLSARLGDLLSHLYMSSSVIKYYVDKGRPTAERPVVEYALQYSLYCMQQALEKFVSNFPRQKTAKMLRCLLFPWGLRCAYPSDALGQSIADLMLKDSCLRQSMLKQTHLGDNDRDPMKRIEDAWHLVLQAQPLYDKLTTAITQGQIKRGIARKDTIHAAYEAEIISEHEKNQLLLAEKKRVNALDVNEFNFSDLITALDYNLATSPVEEKVEG